MDNSAQADACAIKLVRIWFERGRSNQRDTLAQVLEMGLSE